MLDIWQSILNLSNLETQLNILTTCRSFDNNLKILDLYHIDSYFQKRLCDEILQQNKFNHIVNLDICNNKITNISHLKNLKKLDVKFNNKIDHKSLSGINLVELKVRNNFNIKDVSFMKSLRKLNVAGLCDINQDSIKELDLVELNASGNYGITNVSHMKKLKILKIERESGITYVNNPSLIKLYAANNKYITDISML